MVDNLQRWLRAEPDVRDSEWIRYLRRFGYEGAEAEEILWRAKGVVSDGT